MELRLNERSLKFLSDVAELKDEFDCTSGHCLDRKITSLLVEYEKELENGYLFQKNECKFLSHVSNVYTDGRSCPGYDRQLALAKLTNNEWRKELHLVCGGIALGVVKLDMSDIAKLNF